MARAQERIDAEFQDEECVGHAVFKDASGRLTIEARVVGYVTVDGVDWKFDRVVKMRLRRDAR